MDERRKAMVQKSLEKNKNFFMGEQIQNVALFNTSYLRVKNFHRDQIILVRPDRYVAASF